MCFEQQRKERKAWAFIILSWTSIKCSERDIKSEAKRAQRTSRSPYLPPPPDMSFLSMLLRSLSVSLIMCHMSSQTVLQQAFLVPRPQSPEAHQSVWLRGRPSCLLVYKHRDSTPHVKRYQHLKVNLTSRKQTDLKPRPTLVFIEVDVSHRGLERLWIQPWDRWRTINLYNCSLNWQYCTCLDLLKQLLSQWLFVFNVSVSLWSVSAPMHRGYCDVSAYICTCVCLLAQGWVSLEGTQ